MERRRGVRARSPPAASWPATTRRGRRIAAARSPSCACARSRRWRRRRRRARRRSAGRRRARRARGDRGGAVSRERPPAAHGGARRARQRGRGAARLRGPARAAARRARHRARGRRAGAPSPPADRDAAPTAGDGSRRRRAAGAVARGAQARDRAVRRAGAARRRRSIPRSCGPSRPRRSAGRARSSRASARPRTSWRRHRSWPCSARRSPTRTTPSARCAPALRICELRIATRAGVASGEAIVALGGPQPGTRHRAVTTSAAATLQRVAPPGGDRGRRRHARRDRRRAVLRADRRDRVGLARHRGGAGAARATRFVGRDRELALLRELHDATLSERRPHLVTIVGEPGIGKSRLLEELSSRVARRDRRRRAPRALPGLRRGHRLLGAARDPVGRRRRPARRQRPDRRREADRARRRAARRRRGRGETPRVASALAASAGLDRCLGSTLRDAAPESVAEEIGLAWPRFLSALAARPPTVVAIEDLHWAEPALLDMVEAIVARSHGPLLVVATARPELAQARASWGQRPGTWQVALTPLDARAARDLVADMLPGADATVAERVVEVAEGNPFYAEEIVRHLEHGGGAEPEIPATVRALLAARIDALPEAEQDVLQHAAVVGRRFWPSALEPRWRDEPLAPILRSLERQRLHRGAGDVVAARRARAGLRARPHARGRLPLDPARRALPGARRGRRVGRGAGRRPPRRVPRRARPPLRGRGRPPTRRSRGPRARRRPTELRAAAVRTLVEAGEAARRRLSLAQALRFADRALALADGPAERLAAFELRAQQPPRRGPRQPGARRLSRGDRARARARRRRGHRAPARLRDPAVQPLSGVVRRHGVEGARRRPRRPRPGGGGGGRRRLRDRRAAHRPRVGDVALARSDRRGPAARQARRRARGARSPRRSARRCWSRSRSRP